MKSGEHIEEELSLCPKTWRRMMKGSGRCPQQTAPGIGPGSSQKRLGSKPAATFLAKVWRQELQKPSRARATRRSAPSPSQSYRRRRLLMKEGTPLVVFCCCFQDSADPRVTPSWDPAGGGVIGPAQPGPAAPPLRWYRDPQAIPGREGIPPGTH